ncbi:MAG: phosphate ABC transporter permease PstA [Gammaproteobacteria bacterium]|nr:phosphate ABC transporter permease PstA [Gammaproteobacteria bacterium]
MNPSEKVILGTCIFSITLLALLYGQIVWEITINGLPRLSWNWFTQAPANAGLQGGISSILISTMLIICVSLITATPVALAIAINLSEIPATHSRGISFLRASLDLLASIPSIVYGLFGYAFFVILCKLGFSLLSGGLTLACMILPLLARLFEDRLKEIPIAHFQSARACGMHQWQIYFFVLLPSISRGLIGSIILALSRALSETAALVYTAGYVDRMPSTLSDSGRSLSVHILDLSMNVPGGNQNSYASALTLLLLLLFINSSALWMGNQKSNQERIKV